MGAIPISSSSMRPSTSPRAGATPGPSSWPGARFLTLADFADPASSVGFTLPGPKHAAIKFSSLGLTPTSRVVLYDDSDVKTSARAWFILRGYGIAQLAIATF